MHIPENYLSPSTCAVMAAAMVPVWTYSVKKVKEEIPKVKMPLLGIGAAFSFLGMMFNIPLPGGTTGHAVGGTLIAILTGSPSAGCIAVTIALLIQALLFGDGGILAFGANCFNMAFILPFLGFAIYKLIWEKTGKRKLAAGIGSYIGINAAAFCAAIEFGIQPLLFTDAAGKALYCPYPLTISIPAMMIGHLTLFGIAEIVLTTAILAFVEKISPETLDTKSTQAVLGVLSKLKWKEGKDRCLSASPSLKLCYTFLYILLTACSKNYVFSLIMAGGTILILATYPAETMKQILSGTFGAVLFSALILLPAVFIGNPQILLIITTKVFVSVTLIGILSAGTSWNKLTASLRSFHIPDIFIFTLDITLKYIAVLGEICMEILTSLRLRSVGQNRKKAQSFSGILGISFLKSREMAEEMYAAMCCRGFVGEYKTQKTSTFRKQDILSLLLMIGVTGIFIYFEGLWK